MSLSVDQNDLYVNEVVTVNLNPIEDVKKSPFLFTVRFGDGEEFKGAQVVQVQHVYRAAGSYTISAEVSTPPGAEIFVTVPVVQNSVAVNVRAATLSAVPGIAAVGENVVFATPVRPGDARIRYRFTFDDGEATAWITDPQTTHAYKNSATLNPFMEVGIFDDNEYRALDRSVPAPLQVAEVILDAPTSVRSDETATFIVRFPAGDSALRYRVNFGDGVEPSPWNSSPTATHVYPASGPYRAFGEIGRASDAGVTRVAGSIARDLVVAPGTISGGPGDGGPRGNGGIDWLPYVAVALVAVLVGYGTKQLLFPPQPTFTLHRGRTDSQIDTADAGVNLRLELRLHRNVDVKTALVVPGGRLIAAIRRPYD